MTLQRLLSRNELLSLLLRSGGVVASAMTGLISLKVFLSFGQADAASLVAIVGWMVFVPLAQMGFGRPAYGEVRSRLSNSELPASLVHSFVRLFAVQALLGTALFCIVGAAVAARQGFTGTLLEVGMFSIGLAALSAGTLQRDLAYGVSRESDYEFWEVVRRFAILAGYGAIALGAPLWMFGLAGLAVAAWSQARVAAVLEASGNISQPPAHAALHWRRLMPKLGHDARRYFVFTANEVLLYNLPLVVFTATSASSDVIFFGVWLRMFQLLVLPMRMVVDARLNRQTTAYFRRDVKTVTCELKLSLAAGTAIMLTSLLVVLTCSKTILSWIGASAMADDPWLMVSLAVWGLGNAVQHVFGSFTLGHGGGFSFALAVSLTTVLSMAVVFAVTRWMGIAAGPIQCALGIVYALSAAAYAWHVRRIVRTAVEVT